MSDAHGAHGSPRDGSVLPFSDGSHLDMTGRTAVMGVLNVTPDSFYDGGRHDRLDRAVARAERLLDEGADIVDVGGESTRPGADPVDETAEIERIAPVVRRVRDSIDARVAAGRRRAFVSIDTRKARVASAGIEAGADLVNDVSALGDPDMARTVASARVPIVLMHMRGTPRTMQRNTRYDDVFTAVRTALVEAADRAVAAGIAGDKIVLDPGIGFGKSIEGNLELVRRVPELVAEGWPVLVGASRKSFIGKILDLPTEERLEGSLAVAALACWLGARIVRAHDVTETVRVVRMVDAVRGR